MSQTENNPQVDERVWQAWIEKNKARDKARAAKRIKIVKLISVFLLSGALLWRFTT